MKIRTITFFINLNFPFDENYFKQINQLINHVKEEFQNNGFEVQTTRITTQSWEKFFQSKKQIINVVKQIEYYLEKNNIDYFSIGITKSPKNIPLIYDILKNTSKCFCSVFICDNKEINYESISRTAKLIKKISKLERNGFANLRFAALFNTKVGSPFFPGSYHEGDNFFSIATESSDLVYKAFSSAKNIQEASIILKKILEAEFKKIEEIAIKISEILPIEYGGIDTSIAPSINPDESIAFSFEKIIKNKFGEPGTLAIAKIITDILQNINVKKCGYCGLMLPILEDFGLAKRNKENYFNIHNILLYSAVCGTGLDTIPLPGNTPEKKIYNLLLDIASLSQKLNKPLSARLMPIPGKKTGETTKFNFKYFVNTKIMNI